MGRRKQIFILGCLLLLQTVGNFCVEEVRGEGFSGDISNKLARLQIYFETEMYEEASALLDELIAQFPDELRFEYLRAIIDYQKEDYQRAQKLFVDFIQTYPDVPEPYYLLGQVYLKQGDIEKARQYLMRYCELVPEDIEAHHKLSSISSENLSELSVIKDGRADSQLVKRIGFYGACVHSYQKQALKLINGSFRTWSSMGIDFEYPLDLRGKRIVLTLKGRQGGENFALTFRDKFAQGHHPQLVLAPEEKDISRNWQKLKVTMSEQQSKIDLSQVVHLGLEFGFSTVQNPAQSTLFIKDIVIKDVYN